MKIIGNGREKNTLYIAVLALVLMGAGLVFSTWSILERQKQASLEHLELASMAVLQAVDSSLRRGPMRSERFTADTRDFFRDLQAGGDILFVGIVDERGVRLLAGEERAPSVVFPERALETLRRESRWQGQARYGDKVIYVAARRLAPYAPLHRHRRGVSPPDTDSGNFLMVAVDMDKHFAVYESFRKTAIFQTAYILAAAVFLWLLAARFLSRRDMAGKVVYLEKTLAEAEKLAAIGALAAGVAHEIRNPLAALRGFAQYFAKKLAGKQPEEEYAATMVREADRLNRVVTDLLFLAKPRDVAPVAVDLAAVCDEMEQLLRFELREREATLARTLETATVYADPDALKQALLNLLLNSLEALATLPEERRETPGVITIAAKRGASSDRNTGGRSGVWLTVSDTGPGMPEEARQNAFKAFFSTKKKGTGLGLALVDTIVRGHGGEAAVTESGAGEGCSVALFFPDASPALKNAKKTKAP